jgi:hypothetical protein
VGTVAKYRSAVAEAMTIFVERSAEEGRSIVLISPYAIGDALRGTRSIPQAQVAIMS